MRDGLVAESPPFNILQSCDCFGAKAHGKPPQVGDGGCYQGLRDSHGLF